MRNIFIYGQKSLTNKDKKNKTKQKNPLQIFSKVLDVS